MKKTPIIVTDLVIMALIIFFIIQYANTKTRESNESVIEAFGKMTVTAEQIITNYIEDEQHLCDIWANYINRSAEAGTPMTAEEAISYIRKAKISESIYGHLIRLDGSFQNGISTHSAETDPNDYSVSYSDIDLFDDIDEIGREDGEVNLTRAYINPQSGVQSIAFMNYVSVIDEKNGKLNEALLMRVEPLSTLEDKLVFLKGEYDNVEISIINKDGDYLVHGKSLEGSNFFEFFKTYNNVGGNEYNKKLTDKITSGSGTMTMLNSNGEEYICSYTPLKSMKTWFLLAYIPAGELVNYTVVDWLLLGMVTLGLMGLLVFNLLILMVYNRKLEEAAEAANQANEAKSNFLSTMSHDIRTPMNAILGLNEMVLRDSHEETIVAYSESIRTAGKTLLGLINDILDFSKIEAGKMDIINVDYSFASLINDLVNMIQGKAEDKGLEFVLDIDRNIPSVLNGDEIRIKQVITNILSNAVKYTKEGQITFRAGVKYTDDPDYVKLLISVADTGIGIKPEDMNRLFNAFERVDEKKNRNIEGTGLGMSIAQSFLNMMGSHMEVNSEYGKGSTFSFELLQKVVDRNPIGDYEESFRASVSERKKYHERFTAPDARILVVDDMLVNLKVFTNLLKRTQAQIDAANSGDEGISYYKQNHYDIIFLDHMMPDKDGIETLKEMKSLTDTTNSKTPIVCLTANAISGVREMYIKSGFDDYITKPIDPDRLETLLLSYLPKDKISPVTDSENDDDYSVPDFLRDIEDLDVASGVAHCGNSGSYMDTLMTYLDTAANNAKEIEEYWEEKNIKNVTIKVHALKSTSRIIGANKLGDFAERLERAGESGDMDTLEKDIGTLLTMYRKLISDLKPLNDKKADEVNNDLPLISDEEIKKAYSTILEQCAEFDFDNVVSTIKALEKYRFPDEEASRFEAVKKAVDNFDYDQIPEIISE
ncbi:MAG: response regulator [Butyrivibrio sp.]|nr:response regulator [Butyrivibrio sp.]